VKQLWELLTTSVGPFKSLFEDLEPDRRQEFHEEFSAYLERHRDGDRISLPGRYILVLGTRR
jgi:hypothetical protein